MSEGKITSFEDLIVYQTGYRLALEVHRLTQDFPIEERYESGQQLRKAAASIPANIAEDTAGRTPRQSSDTFFATLLVQATR